MEATGRGYTVRAPYCLSAVGLANMLSVLRLVDVGNICAILRASSEGERRDDGRKIDA